MPDLNISETIITDILADIGLLGLWIQAIGLVIVLWIIFEIIILVNNRIRRKQLYIIEDRLKSIEKKLDKVLTKKKERQSE